MSFNVSSVTSRFALASVSILTLAVMSGCSTTTNQGSKASSQMSMSSQVSSQEATKPAISDDRRYDDYYGSPSDQPYQARFQPKIKRTVTKPVFKTTAPKRYVVKKGDTLWGIANKFLNNPSYWPEIWDVNQRVKNPHRIYPGDVLHIYQGGKRRIRVADGSIVEKLVPQMRIDRNGSGEPISTLAPFLAWPKVVDEHTIDNAPYIVAGKDAHLLLEEGQTVYAYNLSDRHAGGRYAIFHKGDKLVDPDTKQEFGYEVDYTGYLEVDQPAGRAEVATATIAKSIREIRRGDKLLSLKDETHSLDAPIQMPTRKVRGTIISMYDAQLVTGQTMLITINKGSRDGIKPGYTVGVYAPSRTVKDPLRTVKKDYEWQPDTQAEVSIPPERVGTAIIYNVSHNISYALVSTSDNAIKKGYKIGNP